MKGLTKYQNQLTYNSQEKGKLIMSLIKEKLFNEDF